MHLTHYVRKITDTYRDKNDLYELISVTSLHFEVNCPEELNFLSLTKR